MNEAHRRSTGRHEIRYIRYRSYLLHLIIMGTILLLTIVMSRLSTVFCNEYALQIYSRLVRSQYFLFGQTSFVFIDLLLLLLALLVLFSLVRLVVLFFTSRAPELRFRFYYRLKKTGLNYACLLLLLGILFMFFRGILYNRISFAAANPASGNEVSLQEQSEEELTALLSTLIDEANDLSGQVEDTAEAFTEDLPARVRAAMAAAELRYPCLNDVYPKAKKDLTFGITAISGLPAYASPVTGEVLYRRDAEAISLPYLLCRETAALSGYIRSEELSYIAYTACLSSGDPALMYSATLCRLNEVCDELTDRGSYAAEEALTALNSRPARDLSRIS